MSPTVATLALYLIIVLPILIVTGIIMNIYSKYKGLKWIRMNWGEAPIVYLLDTEKSLEQAWEFVRSVRDFQSEIDHITWNDLNMFAVFQQLNATKSSVGSEALYQRLRSFNFDDGGMDKLEEIIAFYEESPKTREQLQYLFSKLGKKDFNQAKSFLSTPMENSFGNTWLYVILGAMPILGLAIIIIGLTTGLTMGPIMGTFVIVLAMLVNTIYFMRKRKEFILQIHSISYTIKTLEAARRISKIKTPVQQEIKEHLKPFKKTLVLGDVFLMNILSSDEESIGFYVFGCFFLLPFIIYNFVIGQLNIHNHWAVKLWDMLGDLEVSYSILNYRTYVKTTCQPIFDNGETSTKVSATNIYHPLIDEPVKNPLNWEASTIVTGSNASGKSTYIKTAAINLILAQTINTVLGDNMTMRRGHVFSSMAIKDNIFAGDSYFVAEIKSVRRILLKLQTGEYCYCFIDEILRGTNTIERIAASSSIIKWMLRFNSLVLTATHDIELPEILGDLCDNIHFEEKIVDDEVIFDYTLRTGVTKTRNALLLLQSMDYPLEIVDNAKEEAEHFELNRNWRSG